MSLKDNFKHHHVISIIGNGVIITGDISAVGDFRVDGKITGNVVTTGNIVIGEEAVVVGKLNGNEITVSGYVEGAITSQGKLHLCKKSIIKGELNSKILIIEEGAKFSGSNNLSKINEENEEH